MDFKNQHPNTEVTKALNVNLYPDLVQMGGLAPAMAHVADENGIDLISVRPQSPSGRAKFTTAEAFADFASSLSPGLFSAARVRATETALAGALSARGGDRRG